MKELPKLAKWVPLGLIMIGLVGYLSYYGILSNRKGEQQPPSPEARTADSSVAADGSSEVAREQGDGSPDESARDEPGFDPIRMIDTSRRILEAQSMRETANQKVDFYGRFVDQDGIPISGVYVQADVVWTPPLWTGKAIKYETYKMHSDDDGKIEVHREKGEYLSFKVIKKAGYITRHVDFSFTFGQVLTGASRDVHRGDPDNPFIFKMWKQGKAEPMYEGKLILRSESGISRFVRFGNGLEKAEESKADFEVVVKNIDSEEKEKATLRLESLTGGFTLTDDFFLYRAPESGYVEVLELDITKRYQLTRFKVYYKEENARYYASMDIRVNFLSGEDNYVDINYLINPYGSPNLEWDEELAIGYKGPHPLLERGGRR